MRAITLVSALLLFACSQGAQRLGDVSRVVEAERAFAAEAGRTGWVEAFLAWSSEDAIIIADAPANAHRSLEGIDPANRGDTTLSWGPEFAGVSRGGDFGFTTGPYNGGGEAFGQYFTVWRRQADGSWKWIYDGGTNQREPTTVNPSADVEALPTPAQSAGSADAAIEAVRREEAQLAQAAAGGAAEAFAAAMAVTGRMNRENESTARGREAAVALAGAEPVRFAPPEIVEASPTGDMVFTIGQARWGGGSGYYCRIWVLQEEGWRVGYDQIVPRALREEEAL